MSALLCVLEGASLGDLDAVILDRCSSSCWILVFIDSTSALEGDDDDGWAPLCIDDALSSDEVGGRGAFPAGPACKPCPPA